MYNGYTGAYGAYGQQEYAAGYGNQQAQQQSAQQYYTGVNPYANYGYGGGINAALQAPPPPPPVPPVGSTWSTYPTTTTTASSIASSSVSYFQKAAAQPAGAAGGYNGYDAAVYNYAQQNTPSAHYQNNRPNWKPGGGGRQGRPTGSTDNKQYYCEVCKISCAGGITYKEHLEGQKHKKKEAEKKKGIPKTSLAKNKLTFRCELCEVTCTGQDTYQAHVRGKTHLKTQQLHRKLGRPIPEDVPTIIAPGEDGPVETRAKPQWHQQQVPGTKKVIGINTVNFVGGYKLNSTGRLEEKKREVAQAVGSAGQKPTIEVEDERLRAMMAAEEVKPIGEDQVVDERDATGKLIQYYCKICNCKFSDPNAKEMHVKGRRHQMNYKQQIDSNFVVEQKPNGRKREVEKTRKDMNPKGPFLVPPPTEAREFLIVDDRTVERKYQMMSTGREFLEKVEQFDKDITGAMKMITERINGEEENLRISRTCGVGVYAKSTSIREDPFLEFVLLCTQSPTKEFIEKIFQLWNEITTGLTIEMDLNCPVRFIISSPQFSELKCHLTVASSDILNKNPEEDVANGILDRDAQLQSLAESRRALWFKNHCWFLNPCIPTIRLFRDARSRYPIWNALGDHTLDLIVHNVIDSTSATFSCAEAFKRVLEAISAGFLYSAILFDPTEPTPVNILDGITDEQKHELTSSAQFFVRKIGFNQIHEILGIERYVDAVESTDKEQNATLKRTMELMSGFHGKKLPELGDWTQEEDQNQEEEEEPMEKRVRVEEEGAEPIEGAEPMVEGAEPTLEAEPMMEAAEPTQEAEPMVEGAEPIQEAEPLMEAEPNLERAEPTQKAEPMVEGAELPVKTESAEVTVDPLQ